MNATFLASDIKSQAEYARKEEKKSSSLKNVQFQNHMSLKMTCLVPEVTGPYPEENR